MEGEGEEEEDGEEMRELKINKLILWNFDLFDGNLLQLINMSGE